MESPTRKCVVQKTKKKNVQITLFANLDEGKMTKPAKQ